MNEIIQKIHKIQDVITIIVKLIIAGQYSEAKKTTPNLTMSLGQSILLITTSEYLSEEEKEQERNYWIEQIQRINDAIESNDGFRLIDILYIETMDKLSNYLIKFNRDGEL
ncbi:MAG: hypothetical protein PHX08_05600 [Lachnospiraceae bacterium]|nr:hypothetical protein [Lachnospiraceae bacterium]